MKNEICDIVIDNFENKYNVFYSLLIMDKIINKPNKYTNYAAQGCCSVNNNILISSYDTMYGNDGVRNCRDNSILDVIDIEGKYKTLFFDNKCHVGGIAYSKELNKLYVCGNNCINYYDFDYVCSLDNNEFLSLYDTYKLDKNRDIISIASYLTIFDNYLFVGEFKKYSSSIISKYKLFDDGSVCFDRYYRVPYKKVQGVCIYNNDGINYFFFSCSYGRKCNSKLYVAKLVDDKFVTLFRIILPCMSEQICFDSDGNLIVVFESDCSKYNGLDGRGKSINQIPNVCFLDTKRIFSIINTGG